MIDSLVTVAVALVVIAAICWVAFPLLAIVHESTHAVVLRCLGYDYEISFHGPEIRGRTWPTRGGHIDVVPSVRYEQLTRGEMIAVSIAPFSIGLVTSPIPIYIGLESGLLLPLLAGWVVILGPSLSDYWIALESIRGRYPFRFEPAIDAESPHVLAEGIER